jgi:hypothetical protein
MGYFERLDGGHHVVFGMVINGFEIVCEVEAKGT